MGRIALLLWTEEADSPTARVEFGQGYVEREDAELVGSENTGWQWPEQGIQAVRVRGQTWALVAGMCRRRLGILPSGLSLVGDCESESATGRVMARRLGTPSASAQGGGRRTVGAMAGSAENRLTVVGVELGDGESESGADAD